MVQETDFPIPTLTLMEEDVQLDINLLIMILLVLLLERLALQHQISYW